VKDRGLPVAAEAAFRELEPSFAEYKKLDLNVPQKDLPWQLQRKGAKLKKLEEQYTAIVKLGVAEPAVCALERIGRLYENFARVFHDAPVPREIKKDPALLEEYQAQLAEQAEPLEQKAFEGLELAVVKARELAVRNDCAERAAATVLPRKPELAQTVEPLPALATAEVAEAPVGHGLLAAAGPAAAPRPRAAPAASTAAPTPGKKAEPPLPALKQPAPKKGAPKVAEPPPPKPRPEDPLPRPKKGGDDEDLLP
jgi:hypothetical protein